MTSSSINIETKNKKTLEFRSVDDKWLDVANKLIKNNFFKTAGQFNAARNKALHVIKTDEMYKKVGINGKNEKIKFRQLKVKSINLLHLLDISIPKTKYKKFK